MVSVNIYISLSAKVPLWWHCFNIIAVDKRQVNKHGSCSLHSRTFWRLMPVCLCIISPSKLLLWCWCSVGQVESEPIRLCVPVPKATAGAVAEDEQRFLNHEGTSLGLWPEREPVILTRSLQRRGVSVRPGCLSRTLWAVWLCLWSSAPLEDVSDSWGLSLAENNRLAFYKLIGFWRCFWISTSIEINRYVNTYSWHVMSELTEILIWGIWAGMAKLCHHRGNQFWNIYNAKRQRL